MNKRIRELREQASQWVVANHQPQDPNTLSQKEIDQRYLMYEEKFAELIVWECADIIESQDVDPSFKHRMSWAVKKHFGDN